MSLQLKPLITTVIDVEMSGHVSGRVICALCLSKVLYCRGCEMYIGMQDEKQFAMPDLLTLLTQNAQSVHDWLKGAQLLVNLAQLLRCELRSALI